ncbi:MAG: cytidylate kinase-like family protein [Planctomycetota bacterium]
MSLITVSGLSFTPAQAIAKNVSSRLKYACIDREVFEEAAKHSGIAQAELEKAFVRSPAVFGLSRATRRQYTAHIQAALASRFLQDNVLYYGQFGAHLVRGVPHLMHVHVRAKLEDRITSKIERDACSSAEARKAIARQDKERRALVRSLFSADDENDELYDVVIDASTTPVEAGVDLLVEAITQSRYRPSTFSIGCMEAQDLASRVRAALVDLEPEVAVRADAGNVSIRYRARGLMRKRKVEIAQQRAARIYGVKDVKIEVVEDVGDRILGDARW